jgi:ATP-dependent DNA helicase RecG
VPFTPFEPLSAVAARILLFGTQRALRQWFPLMRIDYLRVPGRQWMKEPDRRYTSLEIRAPLIRAIQKARVAILDDVMRLAEGALQRQDLSPIPDKVIREVVVNAVMHRCYSVQGPIQIVRFANRLEIRNPGYSLKAPELYGQPGSQNRNPKLAAVLHELNIAETKGSGIRVMQRKMKDANLSPPYFESDRHANTFVAYLVLQHFMGQDVIDWLANFRDLDLTDDEAHALFFVREVGAINSLAYRMLTDASPTTACASLHRLCRAALLQPKGGDDHRWYAPTKYLLTPKSFGMRARHRSAQSGELSAQSGKPEPQSGMPNSQSGEPSTAEFDGYDEFSELPAEIKERLPRLKGKSDRTTMETAILMVCEWRPLFLQEITEYLGRKAAKRLLADHISPMIEAGLLERTIPDKPTHPAQKYRITGKGRARLL